MNRLNVSTEFGAVGAYKLQIVFIVFVCGQFALDNPQPIRFGWTNDVNWGSFQDVSADSITGLVGMPRPTPNIRIGGPVSMGHSSKSASARARRQGPAVPGLLRKAPTEKENERIAA